MYMHINNNSRSVIVWCLTHLFEGTGDGEAGRGDELLVQRPHLLDAQLGAVAVVDVEHFRLQALHVVGRTCASTHTTHTHVHQSINSMMS